MLLPGWQQDTHINTRVHSDTFLFVKQSVSQKQKKADDAKSVSMGKDKLHQFQPPVTTETRVIWSKMCLKAI